MASRRFASPLVETLSVETLSVETLSVETLLAETLSVEEFIFRSISCCFDYHLLRIRT